MDSSRLATLHIPPLILGNEVEVPESNKAEVHMQKREIVWERQGFLQPHSEQQIQPSLSAESPPLEVTPEMIGVLLEPCREDFGSGRQEIPTTIGRHRLPIKSLEMAPKWSNSSLQRTLATGYNYSSWRRSRADGNSFYRCVGVLLCEHYCRPDTPLQELATIYKLMFNQVPPYRLMSEGKEDWSNMKIWIRLVRDIYMARKREENTLQKLQFFLQTTKFDKAIIVAMRQYTAFYYRMNMNSPGVPSFQVENPDSVIKTILAYGQEAEGIVFRAAAEAFNVILHIYTGNNTTFPDARYTPLSAGWYPSVHLLRTPECFNCLVPKAWDAADCYDFASNTISPVLTQTIVDYESYSPQA